MPRNINVSLLVVTLQLLTGAATAQEDDLPIDTWKPQVVFSEAHSQSSLLQVGAEFPSANLPNLTNGNLDVAEGSVDGLIVVAFWNDRTIGGVQLRNTICRFVGATPAELVTIYVGDDSQRAQEIIEPDSEGTGTHLVDNGELWKQIATTTPPRLFLLKGGQVVWMDIEYSLATQQELLNAIRHFSSEPDAE